MRVAFCGPGGSGKTTACNILIERYGGFRLSFANALKRDALKYGWDGNKDEKGRRFLQEFGRVVRSINPNYWAAKLEDDIIFGYENKGHLFVDDLRFDNEVEMLKRFGFAIVYIHASNLPDPLAEWRKDTSEQLDPKLAGFSLHSEIGDLKSFKYHVLRLGILIEEEEALELGG